MQHLKGKQYVIAPRSAKQKVQKFLGETYWKRAKLAI